MNLNFFKSLIKFTIEGEELDAVTETPFQKADKERALPCGDADWLATGREQSAKVTYDDPQEQARWLEIDERADELSRAEKLREIPDEVPMVGRRPQRTPWFEPVREKR